MASAAENGIPAAARYSRVAIWLHWIIALLVIVNLVGGLYHDDFSREIGKTVMYLHKATGMAILALSLGRLAWRLTHRPPPFDAAMRRWEVVLARATHLIFYLMLILIPVSGWALSSGKGLPIDFFGLFNIGALPVSHTREAHGFFKDAHEILGKAMIGLILLHVVGALKHHFEGHRHMTGRMAPWLYRAG